VGYFVYYFIPAVAVAFAALSAFFDWYPPGVLIVGLLLLLGRGTFGILKDPVTNVPLFEKIWWMEGTTQYWDLAGVTILVVFLVTWGGMYFRAFFDIIDLFLQLLKLAACIAVPFLQLMKLVSEGIEAIVNNPLWQLQAPTAVMESLEQAITFAGRFSKDICR